MNSKTVFVVGGGTGGHLFPAMSLADELLTRGHTVQLITDTRCTKYIKSTNYPVSILNLGSMRSGVVAKALMACKLAIATAKCIALFIRHKPSVVVAFGGYPTFPSLVAAKLMAIPIMLHEQNCFLGKVNKLFFDSATKVALNFADTANLPKTTSDKILISGNPVRADIRAITPKRDFSFEPFTILVIGGSQGAKIFSEIIPEAIILMKKAKPELQLRIVQQASKDANTYLQKVYENLSINFELCEFFHDMPQRYISSHIVICRAGASTIAELVHLGQPAILIPFPFAAEDHQNFNAKVLEKKSAGWRFEQSALTPQILANTLLRLAECREELSSTSDTLLTLKIDATKILGDTVEEIMTMQK